MLFLAGLARLNAEAAKWAAGQRDDAAAWSACPDPRWMLWWAEYAGADDATLSAAVDACVALAPEVGGRDAYARKNSKAFIASVIATQVYDTGVDENVRASLLSQMATAVRGVIPAAPVR